jgi:hypothetical protein
MIVGIAINGHACRANTHICKEVFEAIGIASMPPPTHLNSASTPVAKLRMIWVVTALVHVHPTIVDGCS